MKKSLLTLAALSVTVAAAVPAHALNTDSITNFDRGTFNLAEAYPCSTAAISSVDKNGKPIVLSPGGYDPALGISDQQVFTGTCPARAGYPGASPGFLCLKRDGLALSVNCFMTVPGGQAGPCFVQAFRLTKRVPGSFKCPDVFGLPHFNSDGNLLPYTYTQFGTGIRTWWALNFTQPGTTFKLEVISVCRTGTISSVDKNGNVIILSAGGTPIVHKDTWTWRVVADANTLGYVIDLMHGAAVSTLEVPCIIAEDMYDALKNAQKGLAGDLITGNPTQIGNDIFNMEALIVSNCLFTDFLDPLVFFRGANQFGAPNIQPPSNLAQTVSFPNGTTAIAGIIDTIEHPCCCKLLVDLEWIAIRNGLIGQTPTLPTF